MPDGWEDPHREERKRILRRATLYTYVPLALAVVVALGGSAFIAWVFMVTGLPFLPTWLVLSAVALGVPILGHALLHVRDRARRRREERDGGGE